MVLLAALVVGRRRRRRGPAGADVAASDGTPLACALVEPDGSPPAGGWPGLLLLHGLGGSHTDLEGDAETAFAPAGYASLMCDARGTGGSGGTFGLDGPAEVQDVRDLYAWLAARPEVSRHADRRVRRLARRRRDLERGGGGRAVRGDRAGVRVDEPRSGARAAGAREVGARRAARGGRAGGPLGPRARRGARRAPRRRAGAGGARAARSSLLAAPRTHRADADRSRAAVHVLFGLDQALAAYRALAGPKRLVVGDLGDTASASTPAEQTALDRETLAWLDRFVKGIAERGRRARRSCSRDDPWNGTTTENPGLPPTGTASVALPGRTTLTARARVTRRVRLTGGPHETFGAPTVTVRYSGARLWDRLVAQVTLAGEHVPLAVGGVRLKAESGAVTIRLSSGNVLLPRGRRLAVTSARPRRTAPTSPAPLPGRAS